MATCPECDAEVEIDPDDLEEMEVGNPWDCDACGSRLRVASLDPLDFDSDEDDEDEEDEAAEDKEGSEDAETDDDAEDGDDDTEEWDE